MVNTFSLLHSCYIFSRDVIIFKYINNEKISNEVLIETEQLNFKNIELAKNEFIRYRNDLEKLKQKNTELEKEIIKLKSNKNTEIINSGSKSSRSQPGQKPKYETKQELLTSIKKIQNYSELSIRSMAKALGYKSDSGYRYMLDKFKFSADYHKTL